MPNSLRPHTTGISAPYQGSPDSIRQYWVKEDTHTHTHTHTHTLTHTHTHNRARAAPELCIVKVG